MKTKNIKIVRFFFLLAAVFLFSGCGCAEDTKAKYKVSLEVWGSLDDSYTYREIFEKYKSVNPQIQRIEYKKLNNDTYKKDIIDALASGQGPDVFLIHNTWLPIFKDKIVPAPPEVLGEKKLRENFVDAVATDFLEESQIWAAPLSADSLAIYYNRDHFNSAGIAAPPKNWNEFVEDVKKLTRFGTDGEIVQSGVAMGTDSKTNARNVNRATDILNLLMLQNGTEMLDEKGRVSIDSVKTINGESFFPARNALEFYTSFANIGSPNYCWKPGMHYSVDAFSEGQASMMLNYSWQINTVAKKSPKLNFAIAPVPQFAGSSPVNYANYWAFSVAKNRISSSDPTDSNYNSPNVTNEIRAKEAWKLIAFLTLNPSGASQAEGSSVSGGYDAAVEYLKLTNKPAARRDLIEKQKNDPWLGVFATDNLIAKSWRQNDPEAIEVIFDEAIDSVNRGEISPADAIAGLSEKMMKIQGRK